MHAHAGISEDLLGLLRSNDGCQQRKRRRGCWAGAKDHDVSEDLVAGSLSPAPFSLNLNYFLCSTGWANVCLMPLNPHTHPPSSPHRTFPAIHTLFLPFIILFFRPTSCDLPPSRIYARVFSSSFTRPFPRRLPLVCASCGWQSRQLALLGED